MEQNYIAAIDIGTTKIVFIVGKRNEKGQLEVHALGKAPSLGVTRGEVINIEKTVDAINIARNDAMSQCEFDISEVVVGIAGKHIRCMTNRGYITRENHDTEITKEDVNKLIQDMYNILIQPGEEIIHVLPQNFLVDKEYDVVYPVGMLGKRLEANFHMVIGKVDSVNYIKKSIEKANLIVNGLILEPLASADAVLTQDEKEVGVALIDIGGGTTDIAVYYDGVIRHTAVIPFGGNVITRDIKEGCRILERQAEELKKQFGQALQQYADDDKVVSIPGIKGREPKEISFGYLAAIIQARMEEILDAALFEIEASGVADKLGTGVVITGGGSMLKNLRQLVSFKTGMGTRIGLPTEHIICDKIKDINNPMYATAVGLLMKGDEVQQERVACLKSLKTAGAEQEAVESVADAADEQTAEDAAAPAPAEQVAEHEATKKKKGVLEGFKEKLGGLFDIDDTKLS